MASGGQTPAAGAQGGDHAAVHEQVAAGDEARLGAEQEGGGGGDLVGRADTPGGGGLDHLLVVGGAGAGQLVAGQRGDDDAGADGVHARAARAPAEAFGLDAQVVAALGVAVGGAAHALGVQERQSDQLVGRVWASAFSCSGANGGNMWPAIEETTIPAPPGAMTRPNSSSTGGFLKAGIRPLAGFDPAGLVEDGCTHDHALCPGSSDPKGPCERGTGRAPQRGRARSTVATEADRGETRTGDAAHDIPEFL